MAVDLGSVGSFEFDRGYAGQVIDGSLAVRRSRNVENSEGLAWGAPSAQGASGGCVPFDGTHTQFVGIAEKNPMHPLLAGVAKYAQYDAASVVESGALLILAAEDARDGDEVLILVDGGTGAVTWGSSKGGAANESTRFSTPGICTYEGAATAGQLAKIVLRDARAIKTTT
jgi:hypothetical protein